MANIKNDYSDYIKFYLVAEDKHALLVDNVIGWNEYGFDFARDSTYHGAMVFVTKTLGFKGEAKAYLLNEYKTKGVLARTGLLVSRLIEQDGELRWVDEDMVFADFYKKKEKDGILEIVFNSNNLMDSIDSYEDDEFEIERTEDYDNNEIDSIKTNTTTIQGRSIQSIGSFEIAFWPGYYGSTAPKNIIQHQESIATKVVSEGPSRYSDATEDYNYNNFHINADGSPQRGDFQNGEELSTDDGINTPFTSAVCFYDFSTEDVPDIVVNLDFYLDTKIYASNGAMNYLDVVKARFDSGSGKFFQVDKYRVAEINGIDPDHFEREITTTLSINTSKDECLFLALYRDELTGPTSLINRDIRIQVDNSLIKISEVEVFEPSYNVKFNFIHDIIARLIYIISGKKDNLISSVLGRWKSDKSDDEIINHIVDGELGLIGAVSGFQIRNFNTGDERYKSPKYSLKNILAACSSNFNLGVGIEKIKNKEYFVIEKLEYFYRTETISLFTEQVSDVKRSMDEKSFYSSIEVGFDKVTEYDNKMGLDEPNVKSQFITPLFNTKNKFKKFSKIRADEYGLEILRRKPKLKFPNDNISGDEDNWFLDLKRKEYSGNEPGGGFDPVEDYEQVEWQDRLSEKPTGIHSPETFRSMLFTPMRALLRLATNFKSGMYIYGEKYINFTSSSSNRNLEMKFIGENISYKEGDNVRISDLPRPLFKNEKITFTHPYSENLRRTLFGKTKVIINGKEREVPNFYFKFEWINEDGVKERGYFLKYEYTDNPTFEFQLANEEII